MKQPKWLHELCITVFVFWGVWRGEEGEEAQNTKQCQEYDFDLARIANKKPQENIQRNVQQYKTTSKKTFSQT